MSEKYQKAHAAYADLAQRGKTDPKARTDKIKAHQEVQAMEREAAARGDILSDGKVISQGGRSKRSLQEEYVSRFDGETEIKDPATGQPTRLRDMHAKRLLGK